MLMAILGYVLLMMCIVFCAFLLIVFIDIILDAFDCSFGLVDHENLIFIVVSLSALIIIAIGIPYAMLEENSFQEWAVSHHCVKHRTSCGYMMYQSGTTDYICDGGIVVERDE